MADRLSALAQLIAIHMGNGIVTTAALMAKTGYSERSIWNAKRELMVQPNALQVHPTAGVDGAADCTHGVQRIAPMVQPDAGCNKKEIPPTPPKEKTTITQNYPHHLQLDAGASGARSGGGFWSRTMNPDAFAAADVVDGRLVLSDEYRAECLELFDGDAGRLTVALKQASGEVQLNSQRSIEQQLNRILGRIAGERRDRRSNYEAAVKANAKTPPAASKIPTYMQRY